MRRRWARGAVRVLATALLAVGARGLWVATLAPSPDSEGWDRRTVAGLRFLDGAPGTLEARADRMQTLFPEGRLFTLALTGLTWANLADRGAVPADEARRHVRRALALAEAEATRRAFGPAGGLPRGTFYEAWTTHLRLAAAPGTAAERDSLAAGCRRLDRALGGPALFPDSYPGAAWPADAVVGAAALHRCAALDPGYAGAAQAWLDRVRQRVDPATGLVPHAAGSAGARGSSTALMVPFLAQIDPDFAAGQYLRLRRQFGTRLAAAPVVREYPHGTGGPGDVDSGPVVWGVSAPASVVGIAAARAVGDAETAEGLRATVEMLGLPLQVSGRRRYAGGQLPVGDAFLAWASSVPLAEPPAAGSPSVPPLVWRGGWTGASVLVVALGLIGLVWSGRGGGSSRARASTSGQRSR